MTDFVDVEDLIKQTLKDDVSYLETVETVESDIIQNIEKELYKYPAALILYSGSVFSLVDGTVLNEVPKYTVFCASRSNRGRKDARRGASGGAEKGLYDIILDVVSALTNNDLGLPQLCRLVPLRVEPVMVTERLVVYGVEFETKFDTDYEIS